MTRRASGRIRDGFRCPNSAVMGRTSIPGYSFLKIALRNTLFASIALMLCIATPLAQASEESAEEETRPPRSMMPPEPTGTEIPLDRVKLRIFGYLRPMAVFETQDFGNLGPEPRERYTAVGARTKFKLDGRLEDKARFYTEYIIDFNEVDQSSDAASTGSENGRIKMMESYVDLYGEDAYWRAGSQIQYWGFINGLWKPTNRFNAADLAFKNRETNDGKLPETGLEWVNRLGDQRVSLMYIPMSKVNKLSPNQLRFLSFLGYESEAPDANSSNSKYVGRLYGALGAFDYQLSYIDGLNPRADFANSGYEVNTEDPDTGETIPEDRRVESAVNGRTVYHRYRSPGLDMQYKTSIVTWKAGAVYYDTGDTNQDEDPLRQSDWYEWVAGAEAFAWGNIVNLYYGQIVVPHVTFESEFFPEDPERKRVYHQNGLLGQSFNRTHVVTLKYQRNFLSNRFELAQDFEWDWDPGWEPLRFFSRTDLAYFLNPEKTVAVRIRPGYFQNREIVTREMMAEVQFDF